LYDINDNLIDSAIGTLNNHIFGGLSADTYYVIGNDGGGCTGRSESCIVLSSTTIDFGLYVVNDANCLSTEGSGKVFVTGLTGNPPFTYLWSPGGETTSSITGLTPNTYSVIVTDANGCSVVKSAPVTKVEPVTIGGFNVTPPTCFNNDGEVEVIIANGTAPYYYEGSNGETAISFSQTYTFTGLSSGNFTVYVRDSGLCEDTQAVSIMTPNGFSVDLVQTVNSTCNSNNGQINIQVSTGQDAPNFIYTLIDSSNNSTSHPSSQTTYSFTNLPSDTYTLEISGGTCVYSQILTIDNEDLFTISVITSGTTCGINNGSVSIIASTGGAQPYTYQITGYPPGPNTYNNLPPGNYVATVTDNGGCVQTQNFTIDPSSGVFFDFVTTQPSIGNDGEIEVLITTGEPPFTYNWSPNVGAQTGLYLTGLTAGTYTLEIIDDNGCVYQRSTTLNGTTLVANYDVYTICESNFENTEIIGRRGIAQMYNEGYYDLTYDDLNCIITSGIFVLKTTVDGEEKQVTFYNSTGLSDYPTDIEWTNTIIDTLKSYEGIGDVIINYEDNTIKIDTICTNTGSSCNPTYQNTLADAKIEINLLIYYNISCVECDVIPSECCFDLVIYDEDMKAYVIKYETPTGYFGNGQPYWQGQIIDPEPCGTNQLIPYFVEVSQNNGFGEWKVYNINQIGDIPNTGEELFYLEEGHPANQTACPTNIGISSWISSLPPQSEGPVRMETKNCTPIKNCCIESFAFHEGAIEIYMWFDGTQWYITESPIGDTNGAWFIMETPFTDGCPLAPLPQNINTCPRWISVYPSENPLNYGVVVRPCEYTYEPENGDFQVQFAIDANPNDWGEFYGIKILNKNSSDGTHNGQPYWQFNFGVLQPVPGGYFDTDVLNPGLLWEISYDGANWNLYRDVTSGVPESGILYNTTISPTPWNVPSLLHDPVNGWQDVGGGNPDVLFTTDQ
jgi:hypothetical protein